MSQNDDWWSLTAYHSEDLSAADRDALQTIRRTLLGLAGHGFIVDVNTYSGERVTVWSYRPGSEDAGQIMAGLLDVIEAVAPDDWTVEASR